MDVRGRRQRLRAATALIAASLCVVPLGGCAPDNRSEAEQLVDTFTDDLDRGNVDAAAAATSYPSAAATTIRQMIMSLKPGLRDYKLAQFIPIDQDSAMFSMDVSWHFGDQREWNYSLQGNVRKLAVGWRVQWDPTVLMPELGHGRTVRLVRTDAPPPRINDLTQQPLMAEQNLNVITLDPGKTPDAGAAANAVSQVIEPVAPLITGDSLRHDLSTAHGRPITAVTLRDADFEILQPRLAGIPGVVMTKQPQLLTTDRRISAPITDSLRKVWQAARDRTAGWAIQMFNPDGSFAAQPTGYQGPKAPDIVAALDSRLQLAAEDAVVSAGTAASLVVIQPSSGAVLAVAQNSYADKMSPRSFADRRSTGSCLDLFNAGAAIAKDKPPQDVSIEEAAAMAGQLGGGTDFEVRPGADKSANGDGARPARQRPKTIGEISISPFGMAMVAATIARGTVPVPMIAAGEPATASPNPGPLRQPIADRLRALLTEAMGRPEQTPLRGYPGVTAFTGYAGDDQWLIATRGDLAFAIQIASPDGGDAAAQMGARLLSAWARPPA